MYGHVLGFSNRWYRAAIETAQEFDVAGRDVHVATLALFIATKLEAFHGRGGNDVVAGHDVEDIVAVLDGRPEIVADVAAASDDMREYIGTEIQSLLDNPAFSEALSGFLLADAASQERRDPPGRAAPASCDVSSPWILLSLDGVPERSPDYYAFYR